ncbi:MFS transporter [Marivita hallyeonensis]|uniref:Sugar phosphate permease n=1 Tax=Marivita hallyeonensis TaxID=996342 RepID=A0A1M5TWQ0_9RHOB|nr:MFS transporter [Marivita hallyeonensis]SHH55124.1 Sugar phosphate permease [Marivita hallyeonensis]
MTDASVLDSRYSWVRLLVTVAIAIVINVGIWIPIVVMPDVQAEFGASRADVSIPYTLTMIGFALGNFVVGRAVDRYGVSLTLTVCSVGVAVAYILAALSPSLWLLTILQFFIGFASAIGFGPLIADLSKWFLNRRGIAVALVASGNYLSGSIWPLALEAVASDESWRWSYTAIGIVTLVLVPPMTLLLRRALPDEAILTADTQSASRTKASGFTPRQLQIMLGIAGIGCCVAMSMPQVHIVALCVDYGFGAAVGAEMLSLMLLGGVVSRLISGTLADRIGGIPTLLIGSTLQAIALFLYLPAGGLVSLYVVSLIFGLSQGGIVPSYAVIVREYMPTREAGARVGFVMMMTILGMALGGWLSGLIYDLTGSYQWAFVNGIVWNGMNIAIIIVILLRSRRGGAFTPAPA